MSVYRRGKVFHYDFWYKRERFRGPTDCTTEREARAEERRQRAIAKEHVSKRRADPEKATVHQVFLRYWNTHGKALSWAPTLGAHMEGLEAFLGPSKSFSEVSGADVAAALEDYAGRPSQRGGTVSNATINRRLAAFQQIYTKAQIGRAHV